MTFADNLVRLRREKGFSQEQLADLMDVSRQAVSKWEAGQTMPDLPSHISKDTGGTLHALVRDFVRYKDGLIFSTEKAPRCS